MSTIARRVRVLGRVQGVFFRDACTQEATARDVRGWVRNDEDGAVTAHVEGEEAEVEAMVSWCRSGPPRARVDDVEVQDVEPQGYDGFRVT